MKKEKTENSLLYFLPMKKVEIFKKEKYNIP
jgi:hypothetical protein